MKCSLSKIACAYADALARPDVGPLVGIPNGDTIYSKKYRVWKRGAISSAANSNIVILCQPFAAMLNDTNAICVASSASAALPADMATASGGLATNAPYAHGSLSVTGIQGRLVSALLRVRYVGTTLNAGGIFYGLQEPTHANITGYSTDSMMTRSSCTHTPVSSASEWFEVHYRPVDNHDVSWVDSLSWTDAGTYTLKSDGSETNSSANPFMGIVCALAAVGQTIEYEFWATVEYAGANVTGKTLTPPDVQGWASVIAAHSQFEETHVADSPVGVPTKSSYLTETIKSYADAMLNAATPYVHTAANAAGAAIINRYLPRPVPRALRPLLR